MENHIHDFLTNLDPKLCVLSTVNSEGKPQSAVVAFAVQKELTVIVCTHDFTRKWKNIEKNPHVSIVFGWKFRGMNVQYEGKAEIVTEPKEIEEIYYTANPHLTHFRDQPRTGFIKITPTWVRITDFSVNPPKVQEKKIT